MSNRKLFISHASKDKPLVDRFVDLVLNNGCDLSRREIFYTSDPDLGVKPGKDFIKYIKDNLEDASLVILMISPNFYSSVFCLGELGGTWALGLEIFPIIVPDLAFDDVGDLLQVTHMGKINEKSYLDILRDTIVRTHRISEPKTPTWNLKCAQFLRELPDILSSLPKPGKVDQAVYQELSDTWQAALEEIENKNREITELNTLIEQLKTAKDREEVRDILLSNSTEKEQFESLVKEANEALSELPYIVREVFYFDFRREPYFPERNSISAREAEQNGFLKDNINYETAYTVDNDDQLIQRAQAKLYDLSQFVSGWNSDSTFGKIFFEEHGYKCDTCMWNRRFWVQYLF